MTELTKSVLSIDLSAIANNWNWFKNNCPNSEIAGVVKANAYGLGLIRVAQRLYDEGCRTFFVAHAQEGIELRQSLGTAVKIFILNGVFHDEIPYFKDYKLLPILNSMEQFDIWNNNGEFGIHIDTGMNRLGFRYDEISAKCFENAALVMSHLACASDISHELNQIQLARFVAATHAVKNTKLSLSASAGAMLGNEFQFDLIRPGIGLYGGNPLDNCENKMQCVVSLEAPIIQTRFVKKEESIGYGASYIARNDMEIAILAIGYADGFLRSASNRGVAYLRDKKVSILGRVSMDLIAIDVTDIGAKMGDNVEMLGKNVTIDEQAANMGTISYEILTRLGSRYKKEYA